MTAPTPVEIERKFLVASDAWRAKAEKATRLMQGYVAIEAMKTVRVRLAGERAFLTIKGPPENLVRAEYEYPIPPAHAEAMLRDLCQGRLVTKTRHHVREDGKLWEVDVFEGPLNGLIMAEIELSAPDEPFSRPAWLGKEVTQDPRYTNASLAINPVIPAP